LLLTCESVTPSLVHGQNRPSHTRTRNVVCTAGLAATPVVDNCHDCQQPTTVVGLSQGEIDGADQVKALICLTRIPPEDILDGSAKNNALPAPHHGPVLLFLGRWELHKCSVKRLTNALTND
jgi:hypothetical protein